MIKLIVGLGNYEKHYERTRHNVGFDFVMALSKDFNVALKYKRRCKGEIGLLNYQGQEIIFLRPFTFMNKSGDSVLQTISKYKINVEDILIIHDDVNLPFGKLRAREKGSSGGQKGMESIINSLQTENIKRLRIGIGKTDQTLIEYVLTDFTKEEQMVIAKIKADSKNIILNVLDNSFDGFQSYINNSKYE
jgi:PTH1 family peptidyl-tRNA hydrolase